MTLNLGRLCQELIIIIQIVEKISLKKILNKIYIISGHEQPLVDTCVNITRLLPHAHKHTHIVTNNMYIHTYNIPSSISLFAL